MTKSKKLLSILAAVLLMTVMTFTTVFAATGYPDVTATIHLTTGQSVARAGQTRDTTGRGYFWGKNESYSAHEVYLIPKVRKDATVSTWHDLDKVTMSIGGVADSSTNHKFSGTPHVYWSVELNPVGAVKSGCDARARIGIRALTADEKK